MGTARDVAAAIVFLASDEASYITGHVLDVNGGMYLAVGVVMGEIKKFRDLPDWEEPRKNLAEELGMDEKQIAALGEVEGDSLDLVETDYGAGRGLRFDASKAAQKLTLDGRLNRMGRLL